MTGLHRVVKYSKVYLLKRPAIKRTHWHFALNDIYTVSS